MAQSSENGLRPEGLLDLEALEDGEEGPVGVLAVQNELAHVKNLRPRMPPPVGVSMLSPA